MNESRISKQFLEHLSGLPEQAPLRIVLKLNDDDEAESLQALDDQLAQFGGKRFSDVNVFGMVAVEAPPGGILTLCESGHVEYILEDQPLRRLSSVPKS